MGLANLMSIEFVNAIVIMELDAEGIFFDFAIRVYSVVLHQLVQFTVHMQFG
jgi:hypothetical protein